MAVVGKGTTALRLRIGQGSRRAFRPDDGIRSCEMVSYCGVGVHSRSKLCRSNNAISMASTHVSAAAPAPTLLRALLSTTLAQIQRRKPAEIWPLMPKMVPFSQMFSHFNGNIYIINLISREDAFSGKTSMFPEEKHSENRSTACVLPWRTAHRKRAHFTRKNRHFGSKSAPGRMYC